jgi:uncharacterized membrane protein
VQNHDPSLFGPAAHFAHDHPPVRDVNALAAAQSLGQRIADHVAALVGSWPFILVQSALLFGWLVANVWLAAMVATHPGFLKAWDPYPFILLNLLLSFQAAYTGPVVMMSQNRQAEKDRLAAQSDFEVNQKAELEIEVVMKHLAHQDRLILDATRRIEALRQDPAVGALATRVEEILRRVEQNDRRIVGLMAHLRVPGAPDGATG